MQIQSTPNAQAQNRVTGLMKDLVERRPQPPVDNYPADMFHPYGNEPLNSDQAAVDCKKTLALLRQRPEATLGQLHAEFSASSTRHDKASRAATWGAVGVSAAAIAGLALTGSAWIAGAGVLGGLGLMGVATHETNLAVQDLETAIGLGKWDRAIREQDPERTPIPVGTRTFAEVYQQELLAIGKG